MHSWKYKEYEGTLKKGAFLNVRACVSYEFNSPAFFVRVQLRSAGVLAEKLVIRKAKYREIQLM